MKFRCAKKTNLGTTLVEVIIATAIIALLGGGIIGSINYGLFVMRVTRENQRAIQVMLERLESVRLYNWDQVTTPGFVPTSFTEAYDAQASTNAQGIIYYGTMSITTPTYSASTPSYATNVREFTVTVQWTNNGAVGHKRSASTFVAKDGIQNYVY